MDKLKAFPSRVKSHDICGTKGEAVPVYEEYQGMDLRDYFAGQALVGLIARMACEYGNMNKPNSENAKDAYELADAMMKQREL